MEQAVPFDYLLFPPRQPEAMAAALERALHGWGRLDLGVAQAQNLIRRKFSIEQSAASLDSVYRQLTAGAAARSI
jgi:glycogen synthase